MRFDGKVALVTGAGSGIGAATAERLASEGGIVIANDVGPEGVDATVASLPGEGHLALVADVSDSAAVAAMFETVRDRFGGLDVLISNAGVSRTPGDGREEFAAKRDSVPSFGQLPYIGDDGWQRMLDVNLSASFYLARAAVPLMVDRDGASIVCVSSVAARAGLGPLHYTAAKAGLLGFVKTLALNVARAGIRVNAVCPGGVDTPMNAAAPPPPGGFESFVPLGRAAQPSELAAAISFLASTDASYITGHTLDVNGGIYLN